ncbi:hypothetical protein ONZ45_g18892 [Pleurotus djamor]|nr:hypothetical protein ONZ45_g18892 [Pleurotus djamor]
MFPPLARHFQRALPYPSVTSSEGPLNIINLFPADYASVPDLGPKAYIATGMCEPGSTTRLHMDLCDAINILLPVDPSSSATWYIFSPADSPRIREYLREKHQLSQSRDPIHEQQFSLFEEDIEVLRAAGLQPFVFDQMAGDVVLIPTGAAHQVRNNTSCVKLAADFLTYQSLPRCLEVSKELRELGLAFPEMEKEDVLEVKNLLLHAWFALGEQLKYKEDAHDATHPAPPSNGCDSSDTNEPACPVGPPCSSDPSLPVSSSVDGHIISTAQQGSPHIDRAVQTDPSIWTTPPQEPRPSSVVPDPPGAIVVEPFESPDHGTTDHTPPTPTLDDEIDYPSSTTVPRLFTMRGSRSSSPQTTVETRNYPIHPTTTSMSRSLPNEMVGTSKPDTVKELRFPVLDTSSSLSLVMRASTELSSRSRK